MNSNKPPATPKEGIDYHIEKGLCVFTSAFLLKRGYCCTNGCRNCPYGYQRDKNDWVERILGNE